MYSSQCDTAEYYMLILWVFTHTPLLLVKVRYTPINIFYALLFKNTHNDNIIPCLILNTGLREK